MDLDAYGRDLPISAELWARLRRADPHCAISLIRTEPRNGSEWARHKRVWVATIKPDSTPVFVHAQAVHPVFAEAVRQCVAAAEVKGWLRPEASPLPNPDRAG